MSGNVPSESIGEAIDRAVAQVIEGIDSHPEFVTNILQRLTKKDRCYASLLLLAVGGVVAALSWFGYVPPSLGALATGTIAIASGLVREFCHGRSV